MDHSNENAPEKLHPQEEEKHVFSANVKVAGKDAVRIQFTAGLTERGVALGPGKAFVLSIVSIANRPSSAKEKKDWGN